MALCPPATEPTQDAAVSTVSTHRPAVMSHFCCGASRRLGLSLCHPCGEIGLGPPPLTFQVQHDGSGPSCHGNGTATHWSALCLILSRSQCWWLHIANRKLGGGGMDVEGRRSLCIAWPCPGFGIAKQCRAQTFLHRLPVIAGRSDRIN